MQTIRFLKLAAVATFVVSGLAMSAQEGQAGANWPSAGQNISNTRHQSAEVMISPETVHALELRWSFTTGGDVSATPALDGDNVYFPDWAGNLYAVSRKTGQGVWQTSISAATGIPGDKARATPVVTKEKVIVGTQGPFGGGGRMLAFDKFTGALIWATQLDFHPAAAVTQSATVHAGRVFVGVSSLEELLAALVPDYPCCSFRGSMLALDLETGAILWQTYTAPDTPVGYSGNAVWGSAPAVDTKRGQVYIATGNNYTVPDDVLACVVAAGDDPDAKLACLSPDDHFDSILALDVKTGEIRWVTRAVPYDAWTVDCDPFFGDGDNCPEPAGPDFDFGQAPALFTVKSDDNGKPRDLLGAGQKSGQYWALDPDTGQVVWVTQTGPGGVTGGLQWGSAVDGDRVYTANANSDGLDWTLPNGNTVNWGIWSALDAKTGEILWQTSDPKKGSTSGPVTTANGVVFGCSLDDGGHMYALDAATGAVLWSFESGGSCVSGAAISKGEVYWGSGYSNLFGTPNNKLFAFSVE